MEDELVLFLGIFAGMVLFNIIFHPFPHDIFDFYSLFFFHAGLGAIVVLIMFLVRIFYPCSIKKISCSEKEMVQFSVVSDFAIGILSSMAFIFYLKNVGHISITDHVVFKVIIICAAPPFVLFVSDRMRKLRMENSSLTLEKESKKNKEDYKNISIDFNPGKFRQVVTTNKVVFILVVINRYSDPFFLRSIKNFLI
jgi:hypothetical protein